MFMLTRSGWSCWCCAGLRTLALRMERHSANAMAVARFLAGRADVASVSYPGIADGPHAHPQAAVAARQMRLGDVPMFGGMLYVPAGCGRAARAVRGGARGGDLRGHPPVHAG